MSSSPAISRSGVRSVAPTRSTTCRPTTRCSRWPTAGDRIGVWRSATCSRPNMTNPLVATPSSPTDTSLDRPWPRFDEARWPPTRDYLHLLSQMLGKLRVAIAPPLPEWFHASLAVTPRGLTTRLLPHPSGPLEASIDLVDGVIRLSAAGGRVETVAVMPARSIAAIWTDLLATLDELGFGVDLWDKPQERTDVTPFALDDRSRDYDPALGASWLEMITDVHALFEAWRSPFFGRSGVNFWWGGFDLTVA